MLCGKNKIQEERHMFKAAESECPKNYKKEMQKMCPGHRDDGILKYRCACCEAYKKYVDTTVH